MTRAAGWTAAALLPVLVYLPTLRYGFVYDDLPLVVHNQAIRDLTELPRLFAGDLDALARGWEQVASNYYRPLVLTLLAVLRPIAGAQPLLWHAGVVLLHGAAGLVAMAVLRRHGAATGMALAGSLLFSLHPAHVQSVAWISGVHDVLVGVAALIAYLAYRRAVDGAREPGGGAGRPAARRALAALALAYAVALLCKEAAAGLLIFALAEPLVGTRSPAHRPAVGVLVVVTLAYLALRLWVLGAVARPFPTAPGVLASLASVPPVVCVYVRDLLWPVGLSLFNPTRPLRSPAAPAALAGVVGCLALATVAIAGVRRGLIAAAPLLWFAAWLAPHLTLWTLNPEWVVVDRYLYLPSFAVGWALSVPPTGVPVSARRRALVGVLIASYVALSLLAMPAFRDQDAFWAEAVRADPGSAIAWTETGRLLAARGDAARARGAFERAVALDPGALLPELRLAELAFRAGDVADAARRYRRIIERSPDYLPAWQSLPGALAAAGEPEQALVAARDAADRFPGDAVVHANLGVLLRNGGRLEEALASLAAARRRRPADAGLALREASVLADLDRFAEARAVVAEGLALPAPAEIRAELEALARRLSAPAAE